MSLKDSTTKPENYLTREEIYKLIDDLKAIRATADLLCMAAGLEADGRQEFGETTLVEIALHLERLSTEGLEILRYDLLSPPCVPVPGPQPAAPGLEAA
jgi:hypothetical protein